MGQDKHDDGGPAFPTENARQTGSNSWHYEGMTLLDWFAGQALAGLLANPDLGETPSDSFPNQAYGYAAAMLAERARRAKGAG